MPAKHVRFSQETVSEGVYYSPSSSGGWSPQSSSPASISSLPSLSPPSPVPRQLYPPAPAPRMVPLTPSPLGHNTSIYPHTPAAYTTPLTPSHPSHSYAVPSLTSTSIAPLLSSPLSTNSRPPLRWDMSRPVTEARTSDKSRLKPSMLDTPATEPELPVLHIVTPGLPWAVTIRPSSGKRGATIKLCDVLEGVYQTLRTPIVEAEYNNAPREGQARARQAWERRCKRDHEEGTTMRRIDFLLGHTSWAGLRPTQKDDTWELIFA